MVSLAASSPRPLALIVDNDPDTREMYAIHLGESGIAVVEAGDVGSAVEMAQTFLPDVITTDLWLHDLSGSLLFDGPDGPGDQHAGNRARGVVRDQPERVRDPAR